MTTMTDSKAAEAQAQGGGECQMSWQPKGMHEKVWTCRRCGQSVTRGGAAGHPFVPCAAPPSAPVGVEGLRRMVEKLAAHVRPTCCELWEEAQAALAQQPAADGGFTAADMMDARQEGRKEAQQPAAVDGACGDACAHIAIERDMLKAHAERLAEALREAQPFIGWVGSYDDLHAKIDALLHPTPTEGAGRE